MRQAERALKFDAGSSSAKELLVTARQASDRLIETALAETRTALARDDPASAAAPFWQLLQAAPDHAAVAGYLPALDQTLKSEAELARGKMEEARHGADKAQAGHTGSYREGTTLARDGEAALRAGTYAVAARAFLRARDRFLQAMP